MGFFDGLTKTLFGGSDSSSNAQNTSSSGFSLLPKQIQDAYTGYGTQVSNLENSGNLTSMYTPTALSGGEQGAIDSLYKGFTPTASSLSSDINMQMNPFDSSVIDEINRQATGQNSTLQQQLSQNGAMGSNRSILGANDIDQSRLDQIGTFKQGEYNTALQNALTTLPQQRQQDAADALTAGSTVRNLNLATSTAPLTALQQLGQALGILPSNGGSTAQGTSSSSASANNGIFKSIGL